MMIKEGEPNSSHTGHGCGLLRWWFSVLVCTQLFNKSLIVVTLRLLRSVRWRHAEFSQKEELGSYRKCQEDKRQRSWLAQPSVEVGQTQRWRLRSGGTCSGSETDAVRNQRRCQGFCSEHTCWEGLGLTWPLTFQMTLTFTCLLPPPSFSSVFKVMSCCF